MSSTTPASKRVRVDETEEDFNVEEPEADSESGAEELELLTPDLFTNDTSRSTTINPDNQPCNYCKNLSFRRSRAKTLQKNADIIKYVVDNCDPQNPSRIYLHKPCYNKIYEKVKYSKEHIEKKIFYMILYLVVI